tara:strand:- start:86 stop:514 length:429 start_codon:yes stop_codon:yes gene_type:complete
MMSSLLKNITFIVLILLFLGISYILLQESEQRDSLAGAPIVEVTEAALTPLAEDGQAVFDTKCAYCHGLNAAGRDGVGPPLVHLMYAPGATDDARLALSIRKGVKADKWPFGDMPAEPDLAEEEIRGLVAYIREMQKANGIQ